MSDSAGNCGVIISSFRESSSTRRGIGVYNNIYVSYTTTHTEMRKQKPTHVFDEQARPYTV